MTASLYQRGSAEGVWVRTLLSGSAMVTSFVGVMFCGRISVARMIESSGACWSSTRPTRLLHYSQQSKAKKQRRIVHRVEMEALVGPSTNHGSASERLLQGIGRIAWDAIQIER